MHQASVNQVSCINYPASVKLFKASCVMSVLGIVFISMSMYNRLEALLIPECMCMHATFVHDEQECQKNYFFHKSCCIYFHNCLML